MLFSERPIAVLVGEYECWFPPPIFKSDSPITRAVGRYFGVGEAQAVGFAK